MRIVLATWLTVLLLVAPVRIRAQPSEAEYAVRYPGLRDMDREAILSELEKAKLLTNLVQAKSAIDAVGACGDHVRQAKQARRLLIQLNKQFRGSPTADYQNRARALKRQNKQAIDDYRSCFAAKLEAYPQLVERGVSSYEIHRQRTLDMSKAYADIADLNDYIRALEQALEGNAGPAAARVAVVSGRVQYQTGGAGPWRAASVGTRLRVGDHIRTGPGGQVEIKFEGPGNAAGRRSATVFFGADTQTVIRAGIEAVPRPGLLGATLDLLRGTLRAITENWRNGDHDPFVIRGSATLAKRAGPAIAGPGGPVMAGIVGSEIVVNYEPERNLFEAHLAHGNGFVEAGGRRIPLERLSSISVVNGIPGAVRPLSQYTWDGLVSATAGSRPPAPGPKAGVAANAGLGRDAGPAKTPREIARIAAERFLLALAHAKNSSEIMATTTGQLRNDTAATAKKYGGITPGLIGLYSVRCTYCQPGTTDCEVLADAELAAKPEGKEVQMLIKTMPDTRSGNVMASMARIPDSGEVSRYLAQQPSCRY